MKVKLRGVRGSIPVPGYDTVVYGGNTTCLEVTTSSGELIILDAGSGIRQLGHELMEKQPIKCHIFITHTHWDHIQGLPFFSPLFTKNNEIHIYGSLDPIQNRDLRSILSTQMDYCFFPVRECELAANIHYHNIHEKQTITIGTATVTSILTNHSVLNFGYKILDQGRSFFFTGDHEPPINIYAPNDKEYQGYQKLVDAQRQILNDFMTGVDVVVADSQYTMAEYQTRKGWGHGTFEGNIELARHTKIKHMYFTHHEPTRSDMALELIFEELMQQADLPNVHFHLAKEGVVIEW